ncbi:hypothetical protein OOZ15_03380 [Galbibacter sp. EGI 63066]|uniref:hypothetical protein n=1 Tax=Galbibacter sp. EGI 63066 TaxID=2993559 RepID=UPI002248E102|nr:hypothetical protein [Galbibacter sp. EGI 63066]MCX2678972.1 hypothetical protein [Galbibacter sp. EGI 63066]
MELNEQLAFCKKCEKRKFDSKTGIVCSLTDRKPDFQNECSDFSLDIKQANKIATRSEGSSGKVKTWGYIAAAILIIKILMRIFRDN